MDKGYVQNTIFELLSRLGIGYEKLEHSPIITMKEGSEIAYKLGSTSCKNLFLCNKRQEYFMLMLPADKKLSAKNVARQIGEPDIFLLLLQKTWKGYFILIRVLSVY